MAGLFALAPPTPAAAEAGWTWPVQGQVITPYRNGDDPYAGGRHRGIDIAGRVGAPVVAATAGTVRFAGMAGSSGLTVAIRSADGRFDTSYLHLSSVEVRRGDRVRVGGPIGAVGTTGRRSAAPPHLHFGVRVAGTRHAYLDPLDFLPDPPPAGEPERPRGAPAPVGAPGRPAPAPAPVPDRRPRPVPRGRPRGHRAPSPLPTPRPLPVPHGGRLRAPRHGPLPVADSVPRPVPVRGPAAHPMPRGAPGEAPGEAHLPAPAPADAPRASGAPARPASPRAARGGAGPDLGMVLACVGLLTAAALLGGTEDGRRTAARGRQRIAALLRPLAGRG
jgi:pyruvate/2-oxoglutarate dehydrogenase complex dihydrolipoamide acyltransferase (E2) component